MAWRLQVCSGQPGGAQGKTSTNTNNAFTHARTRARTHTHTTHMGVHGEAGGAQGMREQGVRRAKVAVFT